MQAGEELSGRGPPPGQTHDDGWDRAPLHLLCLTSIVRQKTLAVLLAGSELRQRRQELGGRIGSRVLLGRHTEQDRENRLDPPGGAQQFLAGSLPRGRSDRTSRGATVRQGSATGV